MKDLKPTCRIAVVQAAPVLFDKTACTDKAVRLIRSARSMAQSSSCSRSCSSPATRTA